MKIKIFYLVLLVSFKLNLNSQCSAENKTYRNLFECTKNCDPCGFNCQRNPCNERDQNNCSHTCKSIQGGFGGI